MKTEDPTQTKTGEAAATVAEEKPSANIEPVPPPTATVPPNGAQRRFEDNPLRIRAQRNQMAALLDIKLIHLVGISPEETEKVITERIQTIKAERTETQILMSQGSTVTLAGKEYEIKPMPLRRSMEWRKKVSEIAGEVMDKILESAQKPKTGAPKTILAATMAKASESAGLDMEHIFKQSIPYILGDGLDKIIELLFLYSEELKENEEDILENASAEEVVAAAMEAFQVGFPLVVTVFRGLWSMGQKTGLLGSLAGKTG